MGVASTRPAPAATVAGVVQKDTPVRTAPRQAGGTLTADQILDTIDFNMDPDDMLPPVINLDLSNDSSVRSMTPPPPSANATPNTRTSHSQSSRQRPWQSVPEQAPPQVVLQPPLAGSQGAPHQQHGGQGVPQQQQQQSTQGTQQQQQFAPPPVHIAPGPSVQVPPPLAPNPATFGTTTGDLAPGNFGPGSAPAAGTYGHRQATYAMPVPAAAPAPSMYYPAHGPQTGPC